MYIVHMDNYIAGNCWLFCTIKEKTISCNGNFFALYFSANLVDLNIKNKQDTKRRPRNCALKWFLKFRFVQIFYLLTSQFSRLVEMDTDKLSKSWRVIISHGLSITPGLKHRISLQQIYNLGSDLVCWIR